MVAFAQITALLAGAASIASASPTPDLSARQSVAGVQPAFSCPNRTINGHVSPYPLRSLCLKTPLASTKPYYRAGSYYPLRPATIVNTNGTMGENLNLCGVSDLGNGELSYIYPVCCVVCSTLSRSYTGSGCVAAKPVADVSDTMDLVNGVLNTALKNREETMCVNNGN